MKTWKQKELKENEMIMDGRLFESKEEEIKIGETKVWNGLEVTKVIQKGKAFNEIEIPEGWDIPTLQQGIDMVNDDEMCDWLNFKSEDNDFYVKQPFKQNEGTYAWLGCFDSFFDLNLNASISCNSANRGVFLIREVKDPYEGM